MYAPCFKHCNSLLKLLLVLEYSRSTQSTPVQCATESKENRVS
jgi:hypothetical protein